MTPSTSFKSIEFYSKLDGSLKFLPFRFRRLNDGKVLLTNIVGEFVILRKVEFDQFVTKRLPVGTGLYNALKQRHFFYDGSINPIELMSSKLWTKKSFLKGFTKLHIFVLTLRCNSACTYCQASRQEETASHLYDMDIETARKSVEMMFHSPSDSITVEFQGGEPLLNIEVLKEIVRYAQELRELP